MKYRPSVDVVTDYHRLPIDGGHVVWETDMGPLVRVRTRLADTKSTLGRRLALLQRAAEADGDHRKLAYGNRVMQRLQDTIDERLADVADVGKRLAAEPAHRALGPGDRARRNKGMGRSAGGPQQCRWPR